MRINENSLETSASEHKPSQAWLSLLAFLFSTYLHIPLWNTAGTYLSRLNNTYKSLLTKDMVAGILTLRRCATTNPHLEQQLHPFNAVSIILEKNHVGIYFLYLSPSRHFLCPFCKVFWRAGALYPYDDFLPPFFLTIPINHHYLRKSKYQNVQQVWDIQQQLSDILVNTYEVFGWHWIFRERRS